MALNGAIYVIGGEPQATRGVLEPVLRLDSGGTARVADVWRLDTGN